MLDENYKEKLNLVNPLAESGANSLSLFINDYSLLFSIASKDFKHVYQLVDIALKNTIGSNQTLAERIVFLLNEYKLIQKKIEKISISILNKNFALVPEAYSNTKDLSTFLTFSSGASDIKNTLVQTIKNVKFCYAFDQEAIQSLEKLFPQAIIKHTGAVTTNLVFSNFSLLNYDLVLVINEGLIELVAKKNNDLLFYNIFNYENNEDIMYYLLFMMEQFNLNPAHVKLSICGQVQTNDQLILSLKKYIKHINFAVHNSSIKLEGKLAQIPSHNYFTLLNQHLCE